MAPAGRLGLVTMNQSRCSDRGQRVLREKMAIQKPQCNELMDLRWITLYGRLVGAVTGHPEKAWLLVIRLDRMTICKLDAMTSTLII